MSCWMEGKLFDGAVEQLQPSPLQADLLPLELVLMSGSLAHRSPQDTDAAPSAPLWPPLALSPRNSVSRSSGSDSGAVMRYRESMREKYGVDRTSFSSYDPERQAPVIEESAQESRGCSVM